MKSGGLTISDIRPIPGGIAAASALVGANVKPAQAVTAAGAAEIKKTVCTHCSVGCTVMAEVQNGVWTGQELSLIHI